MSELLTVFVQINKEARGVELPEAMEIDIAGFDCEDDLTVAVNEHWDSFRFDNEEELKDLGINVEDLEEDDYDVVDTDLPSGLDWLCFNGTTIDAPESWEWDWIAYFASESVDADVAYAAWSLNIEPKDIEEAYAGTFDSDADFAQDYAEQTGATGNNDDYPWPYSCIDWEWASKDLMMDFGEHGTHYFRSM